MSWRSYLIINITIMELVSGCVGHQPTTDEIMRGTIAYPFYEPEPVGHHQPEDRFIIRSVVGRTEYTVEIPGAAREYDIEVPLAEIAGVESDVHGRHPSGVGLPQVTDRELVAQFPRAEEQNRDGVALLDSAFGVGQAEGPMQAPSYTLGVAKVVDLYKNRQFEYALIEINNLLAFYPNSPRLLKMKGTIHLKLRDDALAEKAWSQALALEPADLRLGNALERLRSRIRSQAANHIDKEHVL